MELICPAAIEGLLYGGLYAVLGAGFFIVFGVLRRIDLSYGTTVMCSVYLGALIIHQSGAPPYLLFPLALVAGTAIALAVEWLAFELVRDDRRFSMVATLGIWMVLEESVLHSPGRGLGQAVQGFTDQGIIEMGPLSLRTDYLICFAGSVFLISALYWMLSRSRMGLILRLVAADRQLAGLLGVSGRKVNRYTTILAAGIGVTGGYLFATAQGGMDVHFGMWATLKGLVILVLGGLSSIVMLFVAALGLGFLERTATALAGPGIRDLIAYGLMLLVLSAACFGVGPGGRFKTWTP